MTLDFFIPCNPPKSTAQASTIIMRRKDGSPFIGRAKSSKAKKVEHDLMVLLGQHKPPRALEGALFLEVLFTYPWRAGEPKKNRVAGYRWIDKRPDADNLYKLMGDVMTRLGFWTDDAQVADLRVLKRWGDEPGIKVRTGELGRRE